MDHSSDTMWCITSTSTCSRSANAASVAAAPAPLRSKGRWASSSAQRLRRITLGVLQRCFQGHHSEGERRLGRDDLHRSTLGAEGRRRTHGGAPVPRSSIQRAQVQRPRQLDHRGHVVERTPRLELIQEPQSLLRERQAARHQAPLDPEARHLGARPLRLIDTTASSATVGASMSSRSASSTRKAERTRETGCVARSEWPPSSKNPSWMPTRSTPSTRLKNPHERLPSGCAVRRTVARWRPRPVRAAPCGPPSRWGVAAATPGPRTTKAPWPAADAPSGRPGRRRGLHVRLTHPLAPRRPRAASRPKRPSAPPPRRRGRPGCSAEHRFHLAGFNAVTRTFTCVSTRPRNSGEPPDANAPGRLCGRAGRPAYVRRHPARNAPPSVRPAHVRHEPDPLHRRRVHLGRPPGPDDCASRTNACGVRDRSADGREAFAQVASSRPWHRPWSQSVRRR